MREVLDMMTPFRSPLADQFLSRLTDDSDKKEMEDMTRVSELLLGYHRGINRTDEKGRQRLEYAVWVSACLYDAALNGTDYLSSYSEDDGMQSLCEFVISRLRYTLHKKWFPSIPWETFGRSLYMLDKALGFLPENSLIAKEMKEQGQYAAWQRDITALHERIRQHVPQELMDK